MSATRRWLLIGLLLGLALASAILFVPGPWVENIVAGSGLPTLTPLAQPPLGTKAYLLLAADAVAVGLALGWIAGRLFARPLGADAEDEAAEIAYPATARAPAASPATPALDTPALDTLGWNAPAAAAPDAEVEPMAPEPNVPEPSAPEPAAALAHEPAAMHSSALAEETPMSLPKPSMPMSSEPGSGPGSAPLPAHLADPAPALARIESALAGLAQHGPVGVSARFDALDARLQQMAQQIAEIAALARAAQRTPAPAAFSAAATALAPPADPARRRAMAASARMLLARMGESVDLA